jgi:hypothetical protein
LVFFRDHARKLAYPNARTSGHRCIFENGQFFVNRKIPPKKKATIINTVAKRMLLGQKECLRSQNRTRDLSITKYITVERDTAQVRRCATEVL